MTTETDQPVIAQPASTDDCASGAEVFAVTPGLNPHTFRKFWLTLHLYVGLFLGGMFVLISLTGSALVFHKAIDEWLNPDKLTTAGAGPFRPLSDIVAAAGEAAPPNGRLETLRFPNHGRGAFLAWYKVQPETPEPVRRFQVTVDPYTAAVLSRDREWGRTPVSFIYKLHESLLLGKTGETIVGLFALFFLVSISTGVYLWWSSAGKFRQALSFKPGRSVIRWHYDLHKLSGLYGAVVLSILALTGVYLEFPTYVVPIVRLFSPVQELPKEKELRSAPPSSGARAITVEQAVAVARPIFPEGELKFLAVPHDAEGVFRIAMRQAGEVRRSSGQSQVWIDQYSGAVLKVRDWRTFTAGETFVAWLFPLHNGEAFGLTGRWLVFVSGCIPSLLYVTALRMWWLKRVAHRRQKERAPGRPGWAR